MTDVLQASVMRLVLERVCFYINVAHELLR